MEPVTRLLTDEDYYASTIVDWLKCMKNKYRRCVDFGIVFCSGLSIIGTHGPNSVFALQYWRDGKLMESSGHSKETRIDKTHSEADCRRSYENHKVVD